MVVGTAVVHFPVFCQADLDADVLCLFEWMVDTLCHTLRAGGTPRPESIGQETPTLHYGLVSAYDAIAILFPIQELAVNGAFVISLVSLALAVGDSGSHITARV